MGFAVVIRVSVYKQCVKYATADGDAKAGMTSWQSSSVAMSRLPHPCYNGPVASIGAADFPRSIPKGPQAIAKH